MRHNDVRICATRNKASGWVRVRYMLVCVPACKVRCCIGVTQQWQQVVLGGTTTTILCVRHSKFPLASETMSRRHGIQPVVGRCGSPGCSTTVRTSMAWAAYTAAIPTVPRCSRRLLW
jgi:hypothetical protein